MFKIVPQNHTCSFFNRAQLIKLRLKAMRAGVWFRALRRIDRVLVDLTIMVAGNVRSIILAKSILALAKKLEGIMESRVSRAVREVGFPLAQKLSLTAQKWGNVSAESWASAPSFARFLAVMHINDPKNLKS
jgi:hypothetical protein